MPPEFCLKNRPVAPGRVRLQEQRACEGWIRPAEATVFARFEDEVLAADVETGCAYSFPGISGEIWMALIAGASRDDVVNDLAAEYDVEPGRLQADVDSLVERAMELGLLKRVDDV